MSQRDHTRVVPKVVPAPVKTPYQEIADEVIAAVEAALTKLPGYDEDVSWVRPTVRRRVSQQFMQYMTVAAENHEQLQGNKVLDPVECREAVQYAQALGQVRTALLGFVRRIDLNIRHREALASRQALDLYAITCRLLKNPDNADLRPVVENLRAELRRARIGRQPKRKEPAEQT